MTNPYRYSSNPEHDQIVLNWRNHTEREIGYAVTMVTKDGVEYLVPALAELITHESWQVREAVIEGLVGYMGLEEYLPLALDALDNDPEIADAMPATLWLYVSGFHREQHDQIMKILVAKLITEPDPWMQRSVYQGIFRLLHTSRPLMSDRMPAEFELRRDVDWEQIAKWLPEGVETPEGVKSTWHVATPQDVALVSDRNASDRDRLGAIERLLVDRRQEARSPIQYLIENEKNSSALRAAVLRTYLKTWGTVSSSVTRIVTSEPDDDLRLAATEALEVLDADWDEGFTTITRTLLAVLRDDPSDAVKEVAYRSILTTLGRPEEIPDRFDPDKIDWELINSLIPEDA